MTYDENYDWTKDFVQKNIINESMNLSRRKINICYPAVANPNASLVDDIKLNNYETYIRSKVYFSHAARF